jgi:ABC-type sugar transport system ATPase subunit
MTTDDVDRRVEAAQPSMSGATDVMSVDGDPLLEVRGLVKRYGGTHALRGVDFATRSGEIHALVGENGAGKSTLTRILTGATRADAGEVRIDGRTCTIRDPLDGQRLGLRMVQQHDTLVPQLSITENILLGRLPRAAGGWIDWRAAGERARALVAEIGFADLPVDRRAGDLSAAQRQIAEIAKAVAVMPRVLILDEPSAALAQQDIERVFAFMRRLRAAGVGLVYISHRLDEVLALADRITILKDGAVVANVLPAATDKQGLIRMMVGRPIEELFPRRQAPRGSVAMNVRGLGRAGAFADVSFAWATARSSASTASSAAAAPRSHAACSAPLTQRPARWRSRGGPMRRVRRATPCVRAWRCSPRIATATDSWRA